MHQELRRSGGVSKGQAAVLHSKSCVTNPSTAPSVGSPSTDGWGTGLPSPTHHNKAGQGPVWRAQLHPQAPGVASLGKEEGRLIRRWERAGSRGLSSPHCYQDKTR